LLNVWRRDAGLTTRRSAKACAQQAVLVPVTVRGRMSPTWPPVELRSRLPARVTVIGSVSPELAQVAALRGRQ